MVQTALKSCGTFLFEAYSLQQPNEFMFFLKSPSVTLLLHFDFEIVSEFASKDFRYFFLLEWWGRDKGGGVW